MERRKVKVIKISGFISSNQQQYLILTGLSIFAALLTGLLYVRKPLLLQKYFGGINPLAGIAVVILAGFICFSFLLSRDWFAIYKQENFRGLLAGAGLGAFFTFVIILVDLKIVFPRDLNTPYPESLLIYPAMGYVVEIVFHVLPLALLLIALTSLSESLTFEKVIWPCILLISILEPIYQTALGFSRPYSIWIMAFVALHVFLINFFQLWVFRRYDFISMYTFRLAYYLFWRIIWGYVRLNLLF